MTSLQTLRICNGECEIEEKTRFGISEARNMMSEEYGGAGAGQALWSELGIRQTPVHVGTPAGHVKPNYCGEEAFLILRPHRTPVLIAPALAHHHCNRPWLSSSCAQKCLKFPDRFPPCIEQMERCTPT